MGNALALGGGEFGSRIIAFVATAYLAIVLGPERFGVLGFAFAIISYTSVFLEAGFVDVGSRDVAKKPDNAITLATSVTLLKIGLAAICFIVLSIAAWLLESNTEHALVIIATGLLLFATALDTSWVYKGLEQGLPVSMSLIFRRLAFAMLVLFFITGPEHMLRAPMMQFIGELLGVLWLTRRLFAEGFGRMDIALAWHTYRSCAPLIAGKLLRTSIVTLDVILLGLLTTDQEVGLYTAPYRFCYFLIAIAAAIQIAYLPDVGRSTPGHERRAAARRHLEISATLGIPLAAGGVYVAAPLIQLLFGNEYTDGTHAFQLLLCSTGVVFLFAPLHNILLAEDRLQWEFWGFGVAALINLVLNLIWIPVYGIVGAAWATLLAEIMVLIWVGISVFSSMRATLLRPLVPPCIGSTVMIAVLMALPDQLIHLYITVPAGAAVYIVTLVVLRKVPEDAASALRRIIQRSGAA
jgi:O-antigen/teichoic acid export membrane protein